MDGFQFDTVHVWRYKHYYFTRFKYLLVVLKFDIRLAITEYGCVLLFVYIDLYTFEYAFRYLKNDHIKMIIKCSTMDKKNTLNSLWYI